MNKLVTTLAVSAFAIALVAPAQANDSRVAALGGDVRLIGDNSDNNVREVFPGYISSFHDVTIENSGDATAAMAWGDATLGFQHNNDHDNWLTIMYGTDDYGVIVGVDYASNGADAEAGTSASGLSLAYGADMFDGDFAVGVGFESADNDEMSDDSSSGFDVGVNWRGDGMSNFDMMLVDFGFNSSTPAGEDAEAATGWDLNVGWGTNHDIGGGMILTGIFVGASGSNAEDAAMELTLPKFVVGAEYDFGGYWGYDATIRASAVREHSMSDGAMENGHTDLMYGMGISNGKLSFDGIVGEGTLMNGPHIVGGNNPGLFTQMSVTYAF